jgi:hypothetical protein
MNVEGIDQATWQRAMAEAEAHEKRQPVKAAPRTEPTEPPAKPAPKPDDPAPGEDESTLPDGQPAPKKPEPEPDEPPDAAADADGKDPDRVLPKERLKFREEKRDFRRNMEREVAAASEKLSKREADLQSRFGKFEGLEKAIQGGDVDAFARTVGFKDWSALAKHALETQTSPGYVRLQALERDRVEREKKDQETAREQQTRAEREATAQAVQKHRATLATELKGLGGIAGDFAEDGAFIDLVFAEQQKEWDGSETITANEAAERVLENVAAYHARVRDRFDRYSEHEIVQRHLARRPSENAESRPRERENPELRPRERTNHASRKPSHSRTAEAGAGREQTEEEWRRHFAKELAKSS